MLTPYLEKLIHEGKAEYRELAIGGSGVGTIPVQTNEKAIIIDFTWHPFNDINLTPRLVVPVSPIVQLELVLDPGGAAPFFDIGTPVELTGDPSTNGKVIGIESTIKLSFPGIVAGMSINLGDVVDFIDSAGPTVLLSTTVTQIIDADTFIVDAGAGDVFDSYGADLLENVTQQAQFAFPVVFSYFINVAVTGGNWGFPGNPSITDDNGNTATVMSNISYGYTGFSPGQLVLDLITGATGTVLSSSPAVNAAFEPGTLILVDVLGSFNDTDELLNMDNLTPVIQNGIAELVPFSEFIAEAFASCIHHLRFRSRQVEAVYNFRDIPDPIIEDFTEGEITEQRLLGFAMPDPIQVHTYVLCPETVQVDIWKFSPSGNVFTQGNPPAFSQELTVPNGYRNAVANPPVLNIATGQGADIRPLGTRQDNISTKRTKFELVDDIGDLTELALPLNNLSFPLVNIGYVIMKQPLKPIV